MRGQRPWWRTRLLLVSLAAASCGHTATAPSGSGGTTRFLALVGGTGAQQIVEYQAPPLAMRRTMATFTSDSGMYVLLRSGGDGGFYAMRFPGTHFPGRVWSLVRYDADWHVAASQSSATLVDTAALSSPPYAQLTPDGRYLVADVNVLPGYTDTLLVLNAATLAVVRRMAPALHLFYTGAPNAATGAQVLLTSSNAGECPVSLVWLDAASGLAADSVAMPCDYVLQGALTRQLLYRRGPQSGTAREQLYDDVSGAVVSSVDSVSPVYDVFPLATGGRLVWFEAGDAAVTDSGVTTVFGRVPTGTGVGWPRTVVSAEVDTITGALIGVAADPVDCVGCFPSPDGIVVIDPVGLKVLVNQRLGTGVALVP